MAPRSTRQSPIFQVVKKYPLTEKLKGIFNYVAKNNTRIERAADTNDVVSPSLCDDILDYIGPSLEEHKGCDIIDIHPGACLWSQKLHDYLKPRRHLLMEPDSRYLAPFVQPLLDRPDSAYRHTFLTGAHPKDYFESYDQIFNNEELLPKRNELPAGDPQLRQPNRTLLVTGTLQRRYREIRARTHNVHNANLLLNHMVQASQTNSLFHRYGLVRMLFWHPEDTKVAVLPDSVHTRGAYSAILDVAADLVEVAGKDKALADFQDSSAVNRFRYPETASLRGDQVLERMESKGMHMPVHRRPSIYQQSLHRKETKSPEERKEEARQYIPVYLPDDTPLEDVVAMHANSIRELNTFLTEKKGRFNIPYKYKFGLVSSKCFNDTDKSRIGPYMDMWGRQLALEAAVTKADSQADDNNKISKLKEEVFRLASELRDIYSDSNSMTSGAKKVNVSAIRNEMQTYHSKILAHDRRGYEALTLEDEEFWPQYPMYLLDIQPRSQNLADEIASPVEANSILRSLVTTLFQLSASPVAVAINRLAADAAKDLVPAIPDLTDANKGGRLDAEDLQVRMMTREMMGQLTTAYFDWPFRPSTVDVADVI